MRRGASGRRASLVHSRPKRTKHRSPFQHERAAQSFDREDGPLNNQEGKNRQRLDSLVTLAVRTSFLWLDLRLQCLMANLLPNFYGQKTVHDKELDGRHNSHAQRTRSEGDGGNHFPYPGGLVCAQQTTADFSALMATMRRHPKERRSMLTSLIQ